MYLKTIRLILPLLFIALLANSQPKPDSAHIASVKIHTAKADSLNTAALKLAVPKAPAKDLDQALSNVMQALHIYSGAGDSAGLRQTFDNLGMVYHLQKKYTQAKWFILQSSAISREKHDTLNIISSLLTLVAVKEDIKDFNLAKRDLDEALALARTRPDIDQQIKVQQALSDYFSKKGDPKNATMALNRIAFLKDSVLKIAQLAVAKNGQPKVMPQNQGKEFPAGTIALISVATVLLAAAGVVFYLKSKRSKKEDNV